MKPDGRCDKDFLEDVVLFEVFVEFVSLSSSLSLSKAIL
jgi:hypothetical protein